jgi:hypothetical protein
MNIPNNNYSSPSASSFSNHLLNIRKIKFDEKNHTLQIAHRYGFPTISDYHLALLHQLRIQQLILLFVPTFNTLSFLAHSTMLLQQSCDDSTLKHRDTPHPTIFLTMIKNYIIINNDTYREQPMTTSEFTILSLRTKFNDEIRVLEEKLLPNQNATPTHFFISRSTGTQEIDIGINEEAIKKYIYTDYMSPLQQYYSFIISSSRIFSLIFHFCDRPVWPESFDSFLSHFDEEDPLITCNSVSEIPSVQFQFHLPDTEKCLSSYFTSLSTHKQHSKRSRK